jgi:hypothetical protein
MVNRYERKKECECSANRSVTRNLIVRDPSAAPTLAGRVEERVEEELAQRVLLQRM